MKTRWSLCSAQWCVQLTRTDTSAKFTVISTGGDWCRIVMWLASVRHSLRLCSDRPSKVSNQVFLHVEWVKIFNTVRRVRKIAKKRLLTLSCLCLSVCPSAWTNSVATDISVFINSALDAGFTPRPLYPRLRAADTHCTGGWVGARAGLDRWSREKSLSLTGFRTQSNSSSAWPSHCADLVIKLQ